MLDADAIELFKERGIFDAMRQKLSESISWRKVVQRRLMSCIKNSGEEILILHHCCGKEALVSLADGHE